MSKKTITIEKIRNHVLDFANRDEDLNDLQKEYNRGLIELLATFDSNDLDTADRADELSFEMSITIH